MPRSFEQKINQSADVQHVCTIRKCDMLASVFGQGQCPAGALGFTKTDFHEPLVEAVSEPSGVLLPLKKHIIPAAALSCT